MFEVQTDNILHIVWTNVFGNSVKIPSVTISIYALYLTKTYKYATGLNVAKIL